MSPEHLTFVLISRVKEPSVMSVRATTPIPLRSQCSACLSSLLDSLGLFSLSQ